MEVKNRSLSVLQIQITLPLYKIFTCNIYRKGLIIVCSWRDSPQWAGVSSFTRFPDHTQRRTTVGRTPLDEWSARRRDLYLDNTQHSQQTNIPAPGGNRTHSLSRRAAVDLRLRPRGHWDRRETNRTFIKYTHTTVRSIYSGIFLLYIFGCDCRKQLEIRKWI